MKRWQSIPIIGAILSLAGYGGFKYGESVQSYAPLTQRIRAEGKRYLVYNKADFIRKPGSKSLMLGAHVAEDMPVINGAVLKQKPENLPEGWVVEEESLDYHTMGSIACPPCECHCGPGGTPAPGEVPQPTVAPTVPPQQRNRLADMWYARQVHNLEAMDKVDTSKVTICVLDTGVDINHEILKGRLVGGISMLGGSYQDDQGHGTHVAGIISAVSNANIYMVKVLDRNGSGSSSWIANGEAHCADKGFPIISMSLGSDQPDTIIQRATQYALSKGIIVIAAAGNNGAQVGYPAAYEGVMAISAVDKYNKLARFSSRGWEIAFASYGVDIESAKMGGGTVYMSGTSMATPNAASVMAYAIAKGLKNMKANRIGLGQQFEGAGIADAQRTVE